MISSIGIKLLLVLIITVLFTVAVRTHFGPASYAAGLLVGHVIADTASMFYYHRREGHWPRPKFKLPFEG